MKIEWLTEARIEFKHHIAYLHRHNPAAAARVEGEIMQRVSMLKDFPSAGRVGRLATSRELVVTRTPYVVVYSASGQVVQIMHVLHAAQQWPPNDD